MHRNTGRGLIDQGFEQRLRAEQPGRPPVMLSVGLVRGVRFV